MPERSPDGDFHHRLTTVVAAELDVEPSRLTPDARLGDDLCVDSLEAVELGMVIEDEFEITIPEERRREMRTFGDIEAAVSDLAARSADPA